MPPISALLHTANDALRLGRTLETLLPCSEIVIVDHQSIDATWRVAHAYGASVVLADANAAANHFLNLPRHDWILCLQPGESINESLQASLFEWSTLPPSRIGTGAAFSVFMRQQAGEDWIKLPVPQTRLIPRNWKYWHERLPAQDPSAIPLQGELLHFSLP